MTKKQTPMEQVGALREIARRIRVGQITLDEISNETFHTLYPRMAELSDAELGLILAGEPLDTGTAEKLRAKVVPD